MTLTNTLRFIMSHPLTKRNKLGALNRFIRWQIGSRLNPYPVVYPFVEGTSLVVEKGMTGATGNVYTGLHEFSDMGFLLHFLREKDLFIDIGANIGSYTILASGVCRTEAISIEPSSITFQHLTRNIKLNKLDAKVKALNIGLGAEKSILRFTKSLDTINHIATTYDQASDTEEVVIEALDTIIGNIDQALLLKIDVEGFETEVIKGAQAALRNNNLKAIIIELNGSGARYGFNEEDIHKTFTSNGFKPYSYDPLHRNITELNSYGSLNTIYLRDIEFVQERISSSPKIKILEYTF